MVLLNADEKSFHALLFTEGKGVIKYGDNEYSFTKGDTYFMPANLGEYTVIGESDFLITTI